MKTKKTTLSAQVPPLHANKNFKRFIGIDPGRDGAIAVLDETGALLFVGDAKSADNFALDLMLPAMRDAVAAGDTICAVEKPTAMPGTHGCVLIILTLAAGSAIGAAYASGAAIETPTPSVWKRKLGLTSDKAQSVLLARQLFGTALPPKARHDKCEAALLAYWLYQKYTTTTTESK